jgi:cyclopropane fatty-acyl-phospholipid synthase-like methyltransferase
MCIDDRHVMAMQIYYWVMERIYRTLFGEQQMLHYPLFVRPGQSLIEGQRHFSDHIAAALGGIAGQDVVEVGCGNGVQAIYLVGTHHPASYHAIDLYAPHIAYAQTAAAVAGVPVTFSKDDAQKLASISDASADAVLCVESAHHYPDKPAFLAQMRRVLRPGGSFAIAELISASGGNNLFYQLTDTFCWTESQWREAIDAAGLVLRLVDDVSDKLAAGLGAVDDALPGGGGVGARLARAGGRLLIDHYRRELAGSRRYLVLCGRRPTEAT